ncbi:CoA transferase [Lichenifustis flavocetrariae]|uniref:CoA transferase n=1 Tax=Lichenifustis flavocetrariae TaxID=2949735 RepID=UPI0031F4A411
MTDAIPDRAALPLFGVKVVDFGQHIAGPAVAMILGDLGATVVHVDPPSGPLCPRCQGQDLESGAYRVRAQRRGPHSCRDRAPARRGPAAGPQRRPGTPRGGADARARSRVAQFPGPAGRHRPKRHVPVGESGG